MVTRWISLAVLAVTVPATAYVVSEAVVEEPATTSRSAITLDRAPRADADQRRRTGRDVGGATAASPRGTSCDDRDDQDDQDDRDGETEDDDEVSVVRPCPTELGEDDSDDRAEDVAARDDDRADDRDDDRDD